MKFKGKENMNYLLKGGEFNNKGAEAMTLVALKNIYAFDKNANVYMVYFESAVPYEFHKKIIYIECPSCFTDYALKIFNFSRIKKQIKDVVKLFIPGKKSYIFNIHKVLGMLKTIDVMIDISGFALSDKWGRNAAINYCNWIRLLRNMGSKIYLMPQSFGPFGFDEDTNIYIADCLKYADRIFAREESGYKDLLAFGLGNVTLSYDSVLLEKDFDPSLVIRNIKNYSEGIETTYKHNIGIIPNYRLFDRGGMLKDDMLGFYHSIIERNVADGSYCYYLIAHAGEDLQICRWIKELFADCDNVVLIDHVLSSFNYENFAKKLNFIVASRYHAIVHAYKEGTPAVIIGWADKYETVASIFNQNKYIVDTKHLDEGTKIFDQMVRNYTVEREYILNKLPEVQATSCYDFLDKLKVDS